MNIGQILARCVETAPIQFVHECVLGARLVNGNRRKKEQPYTRVEFATQQMTPNDLMFYTREDVNDLRRKPKYVGIIVWVPWDDYHASVDAPETVDAQEPAQEPDTK